MSRWQANLILLFAAGIWGSTFAVQQIAMEHIGPMAFTAFRFIFGALCVAPFAIKEWKKYQIRKIEGMPTEDVISLKDWSGFIATGMVLLLGAYIQQIGIGQTSVTNAGFLTAFYVLLVPVLGVLLFKRRVHWSVWPAGFSCISGAAILSGFAESLFHGTSFELNQGDFWVIVSALFWAMHLLFVSVYSRKKGLLFFFACVQFATVGFLGLILTIILEGVQWSAVWESLWMIIYAGCLSVGLGFTCQIIGQKYTGPADAAIIVSMETVFATIVGILFLNESLTFIEVIGCGLIFSSVLLVELTPMFTRGWRKRWLKPVPQDTVS